MISANRRTFAKSLGGTLAVPFLESTAIANQAGQLPPTRFLVLGKTASFSESFPSPGWN